MSVNRWKVAMIIWLPVSVCALALFLYALIDQGITLTYQSVGYSDCTQSLAVLNQLIPKRESIATKKDLLVVLRNQNPDAFIVEGKRSISLEQLCFLFSNEGMLIEVFYPLPIGKECD